jgi:cell division protein FtsB
MYHFKDILILALSSLLAIGAYFIKGFLKDIKMMQKDIEDLKKELTKVEIESKRYWSEHKNKLRK